MTAYVIFLIVLWLGIIALLIGAGVVLLAVFGGGAALCNACRRLTGLKRRSCDQAETQRGSKPDDKGSA
jgi:hypothetical protein